jgi:hypothetical protein
MFNVCNRNVKIKFIYTEKHLGNVLTYYTNEFHKYYFNAVKSIHVMTYSYFLHYSFIITIHVL